MSQIIIQRDDCVITLNTPEYINDRKALSALVANIAADIYGEGAKVSFSHDDFDGGSVVNEIDISENGLYDDYFVQDIDDAWELPGGDIGDDEDHV